MRNIKEIVICDIKNLTKSAVVLIVLLCLCILPSLYAWFNILSNWDPYGEESTGRVPFAVVSVDEGIEMFDVDINAGDMITQALGSNKSLGWKIIEDKDEAIEGVRSGKYYAAFVVSKHFSKDLMSFSTGKYKRGRIKYYENEKKNAVAAKITDKAQRAFEEEINATFINTLGEFAADSAKAADSMGMDPEDVFKDLGDRMDALAESMEESAALLGTASSLTDVSGDVLAASDKLAEGLGNTLLSEKQVVDNTKENIPDISYIEEFELETDSISLESQTQIDIALDQARDALSKASDSISRAYGSVRSLNNTLDNTARSLNSLKLSVSGTAGELYSLRDDCNELAAMFYALSDADLLSDMNILMGIDDKTITERLAKPIQYKTKTVYPIENFGSQMAAFYTILAQWVGALLSSVLIHAKVNRNDLKLYERFFGRYILFLFVGLIQMLIVTFGDLFYIGIQCLHPELFVLAAFVNMIVFVSINYALVFAFEKAGLGVSLVLLIMQVAGSGGTFPIQVLPQIYQRLFPFIPFNYSLAAMRDCIGGMYKDTYYHSLLILMCYAFGAIAFGLIMYYPALKLNRMITESMKESGLMIS